MENKRIEYIDIAKGIAICLMVFGHACSENNGGMILRWIYSFHMPLFFISSGVLYSMKKENRLKFNTKKKMCDIVWPYLIWSTLYRLFVSVLQIVGGAQIDETLHRNIKNIVLLGGSAMWFLPAMFCAYIIFHMLNNVFRENTLSATAGIIIMILVLFYAAYIRGDVSMFFARSAVGAGFIFIGYATEKIYNKIISDKALIVLTIAHIYIALSCDTVSIASLNFGNPFRYVLMGCMGTFIIYAWSKMIQKEWGIRSMLMLWGNNSIKILCLHGFVIQVIRLADYKLFDSILPKMGICEPFVFTAIIMSVLTVVLKMKLRIIDNLF